MIPRDVFWKLLIHAPWYFIDTDASAIKMLDFGDWQYLMSPIPFFINHLEYLFENKVVAHIMLGNWAFIVNRLAIVWLMLHTLTCLCIRQQDPVTFIGAQLAGYIGNSYFMMSTASTVGYGDVTVDHTRTTDVEVTYLFGVLIQIFALGFFSYMQSTLGSLGNRWTLAVNEWVKEYEILEEWMTLRNLRGYKPLDYHLERQIKTLIRYTWLNDHSSILKSEWHENLPYAIQHEVEEEIMHNVIHDFKILRRLGDQDLAISIIRLSSPDR